MLSTVGLLSAALGAASLSAETKFGGFVGGLLGVNAAGHKVNGNNTITLNGKTTANDPSYIRDRVGGSNFAGGVDLGASFATDAFFACLSGEISFGKTDASMSIDTTCLRHKSDGAAWGIAADIGYDHDNVRPYVRLGVKWKPFRTTLTWNDHSAPPAPFTAINIKKTHAAFSPGIGITWQAHEALDVGVEGRIDFYGSKTIKSSVKAGKAGSEDTFDTILKVHPRDAQVMLKVRWNFA